MKPYVLGFSEFCGMALEQMMFDPRAYGYLRRTVLKRLAHLPDMRNLVARARMLVNLGESPRIVVNCSCGNAAGFIEVDDATGGLEFHRWICADCAETWTHSRFRLIALKFSSLLEYRPVYAKRFETVLKRAVGMTGPVTRAKSARFFFGEEAEIAVRRRRAVQLELV